MSNKYISVSYKLYTVENGEREFVEEATAERPFQFLSGFGVTLEEFEKQVAGLEAGADFEFELDKDKAYGDREAARILDLDREMFCINGHFDHENIFVDAIVPLQNEDGNRFYGRVLEITDDKVKMDLNHPLSGKTLCFSGKVIESREATDRRRTLHRLRRHRTGRDRTEGWSYRLHRQALRQLLCSRRLGDALRRRCYLERLPAGTPRQGFGTERH